MSNKLDISDIRYWWDWHCPLCETWNSVDGLYDSEPKAGELLHCAECGEDIEISDK